ncbi:MAG: hypothetical protein QNJ32_08015 [Xenococcaceae cyanobacterium MO_167.B27]|nr:hypothetical protein [Xenococcaceae cyanobacterium MO_167.B27]
MKYFFLSEGWTYGRVWEFGGLWGQATWRKPPYIQRLNCGILQRGETLWLYQVEDEVIMLEVKPIAKEESNIGQVVLKRLITAEQAIKVLTEAETIIQHPKNIM